MSQPLPDVRATARPTGLIDTLQAGFDTVNHYLWVLLLPLALDLYFWFGPQISIGPLVQRLLLEANAPAAADPGVVQAVEESRRSLLQLVQQGDGLNRYNLLSLVALPPPFGVPSFLAGMPGQGPVLTIDSVTAAVGVIVGCVVVSLGLAVAFYGLLAQGVREGRLAVRSFAGDLGPLSIWMATLMGLLLFLMMGIGLPLTIVLSALSALSPGLAAAAQAVVLGVLIWVFLYLFFTADAIYVSRVPPAVAIKYSVLVVRYNFWRTIGLVLLFMVIVGGTSALWQALVTNLHRSGEALAMIGHIYISSGLAVASMKYYKERFEAIGVGSVG